MTLPVVICDDSSLARKQLAKALPAGWDIQLTFASNGQEALEAIRQGQGHLLFLDLNMPVMDGYATLAAIRAEDLASLVLVVSGDVQPEARRRVKELGALDFIAKPIDPVRVTQILLEYGLINEVQPPTPPKLANYGTTNLSLLELTQEVMNIAMGQAGKLLGELLQTFIHLPIPKAYFSTYTQLPQQMTLHKSLTYSAVSQGFTGAGIAGEAIALISSHNLPLLAQLLKIEQDNQQLKELETLTELAGLLVGACLKGIAEQLDIQLSLGPPILLGQNTSLSNLLGSNQHQVLAVDLGYQLPDQGIQCDLLLMFTEDSIPVLTERMSLLNE